MSRRPPDLVEDDIENSQLATSSAEKIAAPVEIRPDAARRPQPSRASSIRGQSASSRAVNDLVSDHGRVQETEDVIDGIRNCGGTAASEQQPNRSRARSRVLDHQGA